VATFFTLGLGLALTLATGLALAFDVGEATLDGETATLGDGMTSPDVLSPKEVLDRFLRTTQR